MRCVIPHIMKWEIDEKRRIQGKENSEEAEINKIMTQFSI